jgi:hypothetical protein
MDVTVLLADAAQTAKDGKVYALGLGWSNTTTPLPAQAVVVLFEVPWDETNQQFNAVLQLVDADGHAVQQSTPMGEQPVRVDINFEAGRSPGMIRGSSTTMPIAIQLPPSLPLLPGRHE